MIDNFIKGPLTTLLGLAMIVLAIWGWFTDHLTDPQAYALGGIGIVLMFVKDKIPDFVSRIFHGLVGRWFPGEKKDDAAPKP